MLKKRETFGASRFFGLFCDTMTGLKSSIAGVWRFYYDGFRSMTWGRVLWVLILVKLFVMFAVLRVFFFRPALAGLDETEKQEAVGAALVERR